MIIGITGGTGCGKTTALRTIDELGGLVIDCDRVYHELLMQDASLLDAINTRFPGSVDDGKLNREKLAGVVFSDPAALQDLNAITHGAVKKQVLEILEQKPALVAIDAIGLFESGLAELCDVTVAVTAPEDTRVYRLTLRDNLTEEQARMRINGQKPQSYFAEKCDYVLENNNTQENFQEKCLAFFQNLLTIKETT